MVTAVQGPLHHHLKSVHMYGFCDVLGLAELALYILANAPVLQRMVVDPVAYGHTLHTDDIYSVSKAGSIEGDHYHADNQNTMFAEQIIGSEEFRHIEVTMLGLEMLFIHADD
ncbi:SKP1-like protein 4 [Hordeum vulgare]|nr:SKP1-like protein 4 [Hordeum vulgare]